VTDNVQRYSRPARWFHAFVYLAVLVLLGTGWWFVTGGYRRDSPLAAVTGLPDTAIHEYAGFVMIAVIVTGLVLGARGVATFVRESVTYRRSDGRWLARWPRAAFTGRFPAHSGHFDPGQRLANVVMVVTLLALMLSGLGLLYLPADALGGAVLPTHRWATFLVTPVILGHIVVASGVLPGYRGVWRSMHLGGRLPADVAHRIWPEATARRTTPPPPGA